MPTPSTGVLLSVIHVASVASRCRQDLNASGRYWSTFSLVTVALAKVIDAGASSSARCVIPLLLAMRRARLMADADMLGGWVTVALSTVLSALIASMTFLEPAP